MSALGYDDTPFIPDSQYRVHDGKRPQPRVVTPGGAGGLPPSDAVILFDGKNLSAWVGHDGAPARWKVENGYMEVVPGAGNILTRAVFGSIQLHLEFAAPEVVKSEGQGRGNSGVFLMRRYEVQVLDCYQNLTYPDGTTGALYGQYPPLVNACRKPGEWSTYDIVWEAPSFKDDKLVKPAYITVLLNGIVLHHRKELQGSTMHRAISSYQPHPAKEAFELQDHGDLVRYRNIWCRNLGDYDQ